MVVLSQPTRRARSNNLILKLLGMMGVNVMSNENDTSCLLPNGFDMESWRDRVRRADYILILNDAVDEAEDHCARAEAYRQWRDRVYGLIQQEGKEDYVHPRGELQDSIVGKLYLRKLASHKLTSPTFFIPRPKREYLALLRWNVEEKRLTPRTQRLLWECLDLTKLLVKLWKWEEEYRGDWLIAEASVQLHLKAGFSSDHSKSVHYKYHHGLVWKEHKSAKEFARWVESVYCELDHFDLFQYLLQQFDRGVEFVMGQLHRPCYKKKERRFAVVGRSVLWVNKWGAQEEYQRVQSLVDAVVPLVFGSVGTPVFWRMDVLYNLQNTQVHVAEIEVCGAELWVCAMKGEPEGELVEEFVPGYKKARERLLEALVKRERSGCPVWHRQWVTERVAAAVLATIHASKKK